MKRTSLTAALALSFALMVPHGALASGGPVAPVQDSYISVPSSPYRYAAVASGASTVVKRQEPGGSRDLSRLRVPGRYGIPGVDYTGSLTGLSGDGHTLILAELPPATGSLRTTRLLVLDTSRLTVRARITLPGWSTVDAISPRGQWLYLIHYTSSNLSQYEVLGYDLRAHRLLAKAIVDPRERDEVMVGIPINRVMSAGGRWAYTLYFRPSGVPFVHALDTVERRAVCIDLPSLPNLDTSSVHLALGPGGTPLQVDIDGVTRALIDTRTFTVRVAGGESAGAPAPPVTRGRRGPGGETDFPWGLFVLALGVLGPFAVLGARVGRARRGPDDGRDPTVTYVDRRQTDGFPAGKEVSSPSPAASYAPEADVTR